MLRAIEGFFATLAYPFQLLLTRFVLRPMREWQLRLEERRNRTARVSKISKLLHRFRYRMWRLSERLEKHSVLFRRIMAPIRYVARVPSRISASIGRGYEALETRLSKSIWLRWLYVLLRGTRQAAGWTYEFSRSWFASRDYGLLLGGVPAILLALPLAFCLVRIPFHSATAKARHYRQAATDAWEQGNFEAARLYYRKIQQIGVSVETALFQTAMSADEEGDVDAAYQQMKEVVDQYDFVPAKLWMVQTLLSGRLKSQPSNADELCDEYLTSILALDPRNPMARMLTAKRYQQQGKLAEALAELKAIARDYPPANLMISQIQQQRLDYREAGSALRQTLAFYEDRFNSGISLDPSEYETWIRALFMARDYARLQQVARDAVLVHPENRGLRKSVIEVCGHVSDQLASEYERTSLRTALLELALELDASDEATLERFASLVNDDRVGQKVRMFLETRSAELPANVHAALGVAACARGDFVGARPHFAKVIDAHPDVPEAYNNLAWVLINAEPIDAEQALVLATRAVELSPDSAAFRETRGQVLVKLERWQEAVVDLERALNGLPSEAGIHDSLAKAYEALGKLEQAQQHRGLALSGGQAFALPSIP